LQEWYTLTGMPLCERGVAVAMSLGGRAGKVARSIPQSQLSTPHGLGYLLWRVEHAIGNEAQDYARLEVRKFFRYKRPKGCHAIDHVMNFELLYEEAEKHGIWMNDTIKAHFLMETAGLSEQEEMWVMQTVAGDYSQYHSIRNHMRRLAMDGQARSLEAYVTDGQASNATASASSGASSVASGFAPAWDADATPVWTVDGSEMPSIPEEEQDDGGEDFDDDWFELFDSDDEELASMRFEAFAAFTKQKKLGRKGGKKGGKGKGKPRTFDNHRNDNSDPPAGWSREAWQKRTPCPGCGSRWHRNCATVNKGKFKGKGKGKRGVAHMAMSPSLGSFMTFCAVAAAATPLSEASLVQRLCAYPVSSFPTTSGEYVEAHGDQRHCYAGFDDTATSVEWRYALLVDTGAVDSLGGSNWNNNYVRDVLVPLGLDQHILQRDSHATYTGVGAGERTSSTSDSAASWSSGEDRSLHPTGLGRRGRASARHPWPDSDAQAPRHSLHG
jgi:hypothetical protein